MCNLLALMKHTICVTLLLSLMPCAAMTQSQSVDRLSDQEIAAAAVGPPNQGFVSMVDEGLLTPSLCSAQMPSESIFTPTGWIHAQSVHAKRQYLPFKPTPEDTQRVLTVISKGCANGRPSGPTCNSITRVALLSDKGGRVVVEPVDTHPQSSTWQNGYGATVTCTTLVSRFSMSDLKKVRNSKGEFLIVTFSGNTTLKAYTVKQKHIKKLGL